MAVVLTVSETLDGSAVADVLASPGPVNTGVDHGAVVNGSYAPLTDKTDNTGRKDLFIRHDATIDPITDVKTFMQEYGVGTGFGYGGAVSAASDYTKMKNLANTSGGSKNNADGNSGGLWIDMNAVLTDVAASAQFDWNTNGFSGWDGSTFTNTQGGNDTVAIYGDGLTDGIDLASAFPMRSQAMVIDSDQASGGDATNGFTPTAPVEGQIGKNGDTALGDNAHTKLRVFVRSDTTDGGIVMWEFVIGYSFTA